VVALSKRGPGLFYRPRGAARDMIRSQEPVVLFDGPAGSGKTLATIWKTHILCCKYPGIRVLWVRRTRRSLTDSALVTYERDVLPGYPEIDCSRVGRDHRTRYVYPNKSEIVLGGFDKPSKLFSTEYDVVCVFQAEEMTSGPVETLMRMNRNWAGGIPFQQVIFDCNPGPPTHFLLQWWKKGKAARYRSFRKDNPVYWDSENQVWTPKGADYEARLQRLSGANYRRLYLGEWWAEEGLIFEYDPEKHTLHGELEFHEGVGLWAIHTHDGKQIVLLWFVVGQDWGDAVPGAQIVIGFDQDHNAYVVEQRYMRRRTTEWWAGEAEKVYKRFKPLAFICDSAEVDRIKIFNDRLGKWGGRDIAALADKGNGSVLTGISEVQEALKNNEFFVLSGSLAHAPDETITEGEPTDLVSEMAQYIWAKDELTGFKNDKPDPRRRDDAIDATRYAMMWARRRNYGPPAGIPRPKSMRELIQRDSAGGSLWH
jgi:hypothetical protein